MNWVSSASGKGINIDVDTFCGKTEPRTSILGSQGKNAFVEGYPSQESRPCLHTHSEDGGETLHFGLLAQEPRANRVCPQPCLKEAG